MTTLELIKLLSDKLGPIDNPSIVRVGIGDEEDEATYVEYDEEENVVYIA